jgi:hypothetical protein
MYTFYLVETTFQLNIELHKPGPYYLFNLKYHPDDLYLTKQVTDLLNDI